MLEISDRVRNSIATNRPVLALESTLITHGLPWPINQEIAIELENLCKSSGVEPATIAIINGKIKVGLNSEEIEILARAGRSCKKLSSYDFPWALAKKETASTTVAGTMKAASLAGIKVFSTGGIGGVHRGFNEIPDISHDLECLSKTNLIVVSAGAKAILDLPATVEYLETKGILAVGFKCNEFPAFYYRNSGINLNYAVETEDEIAKIFSYCENSALLVLNPIPKDKELDKSIIEPLISEALATAKEKNIKGKDLTPFLLQTLNQKTSGKSVACNLELVKHNVLIGSNIAKALACFRS